MPMLTGLQPWVRERAEALFARARARGIRWRITSIVRPSGEQKRLYDAWVARGRTGLPAAPPGTSTHEFGLGIDIFVEGGRLAEFARLAECVGLKWAGARDVVHFDPYGFEAWHKLVRGQPPGQVRYAC